MPNPSRWSRGEKTKPAGRAPPPLPADGHLPGPGGDPPLRQWLVGFGEAVAGLLLSAWATRAVLWLRAERGLGVDVLLEEPGGQVLPKLAGTSLTLIEADELVLVLGAEHEVEGGGGMVEPALPEFVTLGLGGGLRIAHGGTSRWSRQGTPDGNDPIPTALAEERDCTRCHVLAPCSDCAISGRSPSDRPPEGRRHMPGPPGDRGDLRDVIGCSRVVVGSGGRPEAAVPYGGTQRPGT